jgi:hypothetical protein
LPKKLFDKRAASGVALSTSLVVDLAVIVFGAFVTFLFVGLTPAAAAAAAAAFAAASALLRASSIYLLIAALIS